MLSFRCVCESAFRLVCKSGGEPRSSVPILEPCQMIYILRGDFLAVSVQRFARSPSLRKNLMVRIDPGCFRR